jgi:hypothetical protein
MEMIGKLISGRYRLIAPLGEGGMATIWRAVDEQLDREVAVKLLREQYGNDAGFAARFKQEARAAGSLQHPNIVSVYDYGTDADGAQFIVMQLVEGDDLAAFLRERTRLETDDAVRIAIGVASALEAAHRRGLVHRDVKPGNILITDDGDVKVTDFGIARAVAEASMTVTGTTLGSVHYFSPEQARGDEVTGASDVYSLGIVLFEMLTGRRPFEADSAAGVALKRLNEDPPRPESFVPVPSGLSAIVMRALQREPADRFPDAGSFAEALRTWQNDPAAGAALAAGAAAAGAAALAAAPPAGDPTVYVPPPVAMPSDRTPPPPSATARPKQDEGQPWWIWALLVLGILLLGLIGYLGVQVLGGRLRGPADRRRAGGPRPPGPGAHRGARSVRRAGPQPRDPHRPGCGLHGERGRHHHNLHQRGSRHGGRAEPDRADARRSDLDARQERSAARRGERGAIGPGRGHGDPQRSASRHRRRDRLAGEPGAVDRADTVAHAAADPGTHAAANPSADGHADSGAGTVRRRTAIRQGGC